MSLTNPACQYSKNRLSLNHFRNSQEINPPTLSLSPHNRLYNHIPDVSANMCIPSHIRKHTISPPVFRIPPVGIPTGGVIWHRRKSNGFRGVVGVWMTRGYGSSGMYASVFVRTWFSPVWALAFADEPRCLAGGRSISVRSIPFALTLSSSGERESARGLTETTRHKGGLYKSLFVSKISTRVPPTFRPSYDRGGFAIYRSLKFDERYRRFFVKP